MKQRAPMRVDCDISPDGVLHAVLRGPGAATRDRVAIALDGMVHDVVATIPGGRFIRHLHWHLPRHFIALSLELLAVPDGELLLPVPVDLNRTYALRADPPSLHGLVLQGSFAAARFLADSIGVELLDGSTQAGQALAHRAADSELWHYAVPLGTLLTPGRTARLALRIGGRVLETPSVILTPADLGYLGCLDIATPLRVEGWAVDLRDRTRRVMLDVLVDNAVVATIEASQKRPDLAGVQSTDGKCGFAAELPEPADLHARKRIGVRIAGERTELAGSPVLIDPMPDLLGRFDTLHGMSAHGWALDLSHPGRKRHGGGGGSRRRSARQRAGQQFPRRSARRRPRRRSVRLQDRPLGAFRPPGRPGYRGAFRRHQRDARRLADPHPAERQHATFPPPAGRAGKKPGVLPRLKRALTHRAGDVGISIIMPVHNTPRTWLSEALESVRHQFCDNWELICIDDGSTAPHVSELLASYAAQRQPRVRVLSSPQNVGVTRATNFGLRAARYPYVTFLDHDDYLEPDAVWQLIRAAQLTNADLLYGDEVLTDENLRGVLEFRLRPAFSHDYYLSHPYFVHPICVRTELARRIGGWDETMPISADVDFVLRVIEGAQARGARARGPVSLAHPCRQHAATPSRNSVMAATIGALQRHLDRLGTGARVSEGPWFNQFRIDWPRSERHDPDRHPDQERPRTVADGRRQHRTHRRRCRLPPRRDRPRVRRPRTRSPICATSPPATSSCPTRANSISPA